MRANGGSVKRARDQLGLSWGQFNRLAQKADVPTMWLGVWSDEELRSIIEVHGSLSGACLELGVPPKTMYVALKRRGIKPRFRRASRVGSILRDFSNEEIANIYRNAGTLRNAGDALGVNASTVAEELKRRGIPRRVPIAWRRGTGPCTSD